ncbi:MAG: hypothetical protein AAFX46_23015, partial [Cyanobacteria bacterium J06636_27]
IISRLNLFLDNYKLDFLLSYFYYVRSCATLRENSVYNVKSDLALKRNYEPFSLLSCKRKIQKQD